MNSKRELRKGIQQIAGEHDGVCIVLCEVEKVYEDSRTCDCVSVNGKSDLEFKNVSLMASVDDGVLYIPSLGSQVIISYSIRTNPFVSMFSALDKIQYIVGDYGFEISPEGMKINDGSFGGLVKIEELVKKVNALEDLTNNILTALKSTTIPLAPSGTYPFAPLYASMNLISPITKRSDIENAKVTHGESIPDA